MTTPTPTNTNMPRGDPDPSQSDTPVLEGPPRPPVEVSAPSSSASGPNGPSIASLLSPARPVSSAVGSESLSPRVAKRLRLGHSLGGHGSTRHLPRTSTPGGAYTSFPAVPTTGTTVTGPAGTGEDGKGDEADYDDRFGIETKSLSSSIREHIMEDGRRYHAYHAGKYPFPNDEPEQEREELNHELVLLLCGEQHFFAPVHAALESGAEVFDLGTGTGRWIIELADLYPKSTWTGVDLSPIQPEMVPPNAHFIVDDIEHDNGWEMPENHYDFIHVRHSMYAFRDKNMVLERIFKHLKPGGWVELQEFHIMPYADDSSLTDDMSYRFRDWCVLMHQGCAALGLDETFAILEAETDLARHGFANIARRSWKCPIGSWPQVRALKQLGEMHREALLEAIVHLSRRVFTKGLGWTALQLEMFLVEVRQSLLNARFHTYFPFHCIYGWKPLLPTAVVMSPPQPPPAEFSPAEFSPPQLPPPPPPSPPPLPIPPRSDTPSIGPPTTSRSGSAPAPPSEAK